MLKLPKQKKRKKHLSALVLCFFCLFFLHADGSRSMIKRFSEVVTIHSDEDMVVDVCTRFYGTPSSNCLDVSHITT